jgi:hypothetical protein
VGAFPGDPLSNDLYDNLIPKYFFLHSLHDSTSLFLCYQAIKVEAQDASPERPPMGSCPSVRTCPFGVIASRRHKEWGFHRWYFWSTCLHLPDLSCFHDSRQRLGRGPVFFSIRSSHDRRSRCGGGWWLNICSHMRRRRWQIRWMLWMRIALHML